MKIKIGDYTDYFGPYQLAEKLCFWVKETPDEYGIPSKPKWVHNFGEWLAHGSVEPERKVGEVYDLLNAERHTTWLYKFLIWINGFKERKIKVRIDPWDTWNMQDTLGYIIRPMLKQLQKDKHGSPYVEFEDVPVELRPKEKRTEDNLWVDDTHHQRWEWVLNEMIFAFDTLAGGDNADWESQFFTGNIDFQWKQLEDGMSEMVNGPDHTSVFDKEGYDEYHKRIQNGFRLFGKYYQNLWD